MQNQTLLSIGNLQIETNYRLRIITNIEEKDYENNKVMNNSKKSPASEIYENQKLLAYNLEIRKLQFNDSGWYECQLNTKPTIKNYIYLKVLSLYFDVEFKLYLRIKKELLTF